MDQSKRNVSSTTMPDFTEWAKELVHRLSLGEIRLNLEVGFFTRLLNDPDHLAVIQMHAAVETTINELIAVGFNRPHGGLGGESNKVRFAKVAKFCQKLPLSGPQGKLELTKLLGLIGKENEDFVIALTKIRNRYAHNIRNSGKPLNGMIEEAMAGDKHFRRKLLSAPAELSHENWILKLRLVVRFSYFLEDMERHHVPLKGLASLFMAS